MEKVISQENLAFIKETIKHISEKLKFDNYKQGLWLAFGSFVINRNEVGSDLDLIAINDYFEKDTKIVDSFKSIPIHFTGINMKILQDDGESRLYGSYFSGKIINPHIFLYSNHILKEEALSHAGKFIAPLAGFLGGMIKKDGFTASQITALVFIAYLSTDPSFDSYFLNYFVSPNFNNIWIALCESTTEMLKVSKSIKESNNKLYFVDKFRDYKSFHEERMKISARHWSYGAVCHGGDRQFQDSIFTKAKEKMNRIDPTGNKYRSMVRFLKEKSKLPDIYI